MTDKPYIVNTKDIKQLMDTDKIFAVIQAKYGNPPAWMRPPGNRSAEYNISH